MIKKRIYDLDKNHSAHYIPNSRLIDQILNPRLLPFPLLIRFSELEEFPEALPGCMP